MSSKSVVACLVLLFLLAVATTAHAQQIGPGSGITTNTVDTAGGRTNISDNGGTAGTFLVAGTYDVLDFEYTSGSASAGGTVQPFLATAVGDTYTPIWIGPAQTGGAAGLVTETFAAEAFTLASDSTIFAGFTQTGSALVRVEYPGPGPTSDHNSTPLALVVGTSFGTNNPNIPRTYAYEINVAFVPEPASIAIWSLLGLATAGFIAYRRRRRA